LYEVATEVHLAFKEQRKAVSKTYAERRNMLSSYKEIIEAIRLLVNSLGDADCIEQLHLYATISILVDQVREESCKPSETSDVSDMLGVIKDSCRNFAVGTVKSDNLLTQANTYLDKLERRLP
jgi:hypothetical protein